MASEEEVVDLAKKADALGIEFSLSPREDPEDAKARRAREAAIARAQLRKESTLFYVAIAAIVVVALGCAYGLVVTKSAESERWYQSVLTLIVGGLVGYLARGDKK